MTNEEQQALDSIKFDDYKKRIVSASWSTHMETLPRPFTSYLLPFTSYRVGHRSLFASWAISSRHRDLIVM